MRNTSILRALTVGLIMVIVAACGGSATTTTQAGDTTTTTTTTQAPETTTTTQAPETTTTEAPLGGAITIYAGRAEELVGPLIERFEQETGVQVRVRYAGSTELAANILDEGASGPADVFFAQDPGSLGAVALAGLFAPLPDSITSLVPADLADPDGFWVGASARSRVVVYDPSEVSVDELPANEDGFTEAQWRGRVGIAPTNASFLSFVCAKIILDGEEATAEWLNGMAANNSPTFSGNGAILTAVAEGQVETGLINHYYLGGRRAENPDISAENHFFTQPSAASLVMPAGAGVLASTTNKEAAEAFVAFLLSPEAQEYFATQTYEYPVVAGVAAPEGLPPLDSLPQPDIDLSELATVVDTATDLIAAAGLV